MDRDAESALKIAHAFIEAELETRKASLLPITDGDPSDDQGYITEAETALKAVTDALTKPVP